MAAKSDKSLDNWRNYFAAANSDIFDIIEHAIVVAATDWHKEFRLRRDRIAQTLFSIKLTRCSGCDRVELAVPHGDEQEEENDEQGRKSGLAGEDGVGSKESKVNSTSINGDDVDDGDHHHQHVEMKMQEQQHSNHHVSNYSFGEAEALTDEIEEESQTFGEVLRIKEIIENSQNESESMLFESLRRLQLMILSVETLKATEIGKAVNVLRKHGSDEIRNLACTLIDGWKEMVDEWVSATAAIGGSETTPESVNPSVLDEEEGLPSPPLDDLAFLSTSMELSQFFDGMDDDGNPRNCEKNLGTGRKPAAADTCMIPNPKQQFPKESITLPKDKNGGHTKKQESVLKKQGTLLKPNKPSIGESGPGRPTKPSVEQKVHTVAKFQQNSEKSTIERRSLPSQQDKSRSDMAASEMKLEATKRKLQEGYQQAKNEKKQRTIQVVELHDLPKQRLGHKNSNVRPGNHRSVRPGNHNRHWSNGRH